MKAGEFFSHLSYLLLLKAKETAVLGGDTSKVMNLCKVVKESQEMLNGNINLTLSDLLFTVKAPQKSTV